MKPLSCGANILEPSSDCSVFHKIIEINAFFKNPKLSRKPQAVSMICFRVQSKANRMRGEMNYDFPLEQFKQTQSFVNQYLMLVSFHYYYYSLTASCMCVISFSIPPHTYTPLPSTQAILQGVVFDHGCQLRVTHYTSVLYIRFYFPHYR